MEINNFIKECHQIAIDKGFYEPKSCEDCIYKNKLSDDISSEAWNCKIDKAELHNYGEGCKWGKSKNRNISELLMLIVSELGEAQEALRKNKMIKEKDPLKIEHCYFRDGIFSPSIFESIVKDTFEDEIADTFIRLFDLCRYMNIDIEKHILAKMEYNKSRPYKHNKKF